MPAKKRSEKPAGSRSVKGAASPQAQSPRFCCVRCFTDRALRAFVLANGAKGPCTFCGSTSSTTIEFSKLIPIIDAGISRKYKAGSSGTDLASLLANERMFEDPIYHRELLEAIAHESAFRESSLSEIRTAEPVCRIGNWQTFCDLVKNRARYSALNEFFFRLNKADIASFPNLFGVVHPQIDALFGLIVKHIGRLEYELPEKSLVYRAQVLSSADKPTADRLSSPPVKFTCNGRMNPVGISYFYGADDPDTAAAEIRPHVDAKVAIGRFIVARTLRLIDLTFTPPEASIFDDRFDVEWDEAARPFFEELQQALALPVDPKMEAVDYVPTQVFCDFVRNFPFGSFDGIRYRSSLRPEGTCLVLFRGPDIHRGDGKWLRFGGHSCIRITSIRYTHYVETRNDSKHQRVPPVDLAVMPNVELDVDFGRLSIRPFWSVDRTEFPDIRLYLQAREYMLRFVDMTGRPTKQGSCVTYAGKAFGPLSDVERQYIQAAVDVLFFSAVAPPIVLRVATGRSVVLSPMAENYQLVFTPLTPDDEAIELILGNNCDSGYDIHQVIIQLPYLTHSRTGQPSRSILNLLEPLLEKIWEPDYRSLFYSLDRFRRAHYSNQDLAAELKISLMTKALVSQVGHVQEGTETPVHDRLGAAIAIRDTVWTSNSKNLQTIQAWSTELLNMSREVPMGGDPDRNTINRLHSAAVVAYSKLLLDTVMKLNPKGGTLDSEAGLYHRDFGGSIEHWKRYVVYEEVKLFDAYEKLGWIHKASDTITHGPARPPNKRNWGPRGRIEIR